MAEVTFPQICLQMYWLSLVALRRCEDKVNCESYNANFEIICTEYKEWASFNCEKYCGMCRTPTETVTCADRSNNCASHGRDVCTKYRRWASDMCRAHCGFCKEPSTALQTCENEHSGCAEYGKNLCTLYKEWASINCKAYCGFCKEPSTTTVATRTRPSRQAGTCADKYKHHYSGQHTACLSRSSKYIRLTGVSDENKKIIVSLHNKVRSEVSDGSYMLKMTWDDELAMVAQRWAEVCLFEHDKNREIPGRYQVGQNIAFTTDLETGWSEIVMDFWASEKQYYSLGDKWSGKTAHYILMVSAQTYRVGCGEAICENIGHNYVCNYAPRYFSEHPYKRGTLGHACPATIDRDRLCDCRGKVCYNGGIIDPNTCQCKCKGSSTLNYKPENNCKLFCKSAKDPKYCNRAPFRNNCKKYVNVPQECPFMCNVCDWAGEDYTLAVVQNGSDFSNPSLTMTAFAVCARLCLRMVGGVLKQF